MSLIIAAYRRHSKRAIDDRLRAGAAGFRPAPLGGAQSMAGQREGGA